MAVPSERSDFVPVIVSRLEKLGGKVLRASPTRGSNVEGAEGAFVAGMRGMLARYVGAEIAIRRLDGDQHEELRTLLPHIARIGTVVSVDMYVSAFLFGAWSSFETLVYAANGIGRVLDHAGFAQPGSGISPHHVLGRTPPAKPAPPLPGYERTLPEFSAAMRTREQFLSDLKDQHDVSKHRHAVTPTGEIDVSFLNALAPEIRDALTPRALHYGSWRKLGLSRDVRTVGPRAPNKPALPARPLDEFVLGWREALHATLAALERDLRRIDGDGA